MSDAKGLTLNIRRPVLHVLQRRSQTFLVYVFFDRCTSKSASQITWCRLISDVCLMPVKAQEERCWRDGTGSARALAHSCRATKTWSESTGTRAESSHCLGAPLGRCFWGVRPRQEHKVRRSTNCSTPLRPHICWMPGEISALQRGWQAVVL